MCDTGKSSIPGHPIVEMELDLEIGMGTPINELENLKI